jgi:hypothetical protein
MPLNGQWFVASQITADGKYFPFGGPQWTADGGVPSAYPSIPMPNFVGLDFYTASTMCFANGFVPEVFGYRKIPTIAAGTVLTQSAPAQAVLSGLVSPPNTVVGMTIAANPFLLSVTQDETA